MKLETKRDKTARELRARKIQMSDFLRKYCQGGSSGASRVRAALSCTEMGCVSSSEIGLTAEERRNEKNLERRLREDSRREATVQKLLLLGAGESGKSTLFKQMAYIHKQGYGSDDERREFIPVVYSNTITAIQAVCANCARLARCGDAEGNDEFLACEIKDRKLVKSRDFVMSLRPLDDRLTERTNAHIQRLAESAPVRNAMRQQGRFPFPDSSEYFFSRLGATWRPDYCPTLQDILRCRVRTTGILEQRYEVKNTDRYGVYASGQFHLFDVGGQRNERKKWIHLFENVTAVMFVASLSGYDQILYEDKAENRMEESLKLFHEICGQRWFSNTSMILFLNKSDLFTQKLPYSPLTVCFPDYKGRSIKEATDYIKAEFEARFRDARRAHRNANAAYNDLYTHVTNATDTSHVEFVFNTCEDIIVRTSLKAAGLLAAS